MIKKKSTREGVFEFLHPDPQLDQNFKHTRNLRGQLLTTYIYIYEDPRHGPDHFRGPNPKSGFGPPCGQNIPCLFFNSE